MYGTPCNGVLFPQWHLREQIIYIDGNQENEACPYVGVGFINPGSLVDWLHQQRLGPADDVANDAQTPKR